MIREANNKRKPIAIWLPGGLGGGYFSQGQPALMQLVEGLSKHFRVTVFSLRSPGDFIPVNYQIVSSRTSGLLGWTYLTFRFFRYQLENHYKLLYACWGFPAGFIVVLLSKVLRIPSVIHLQGGEVAKLEEINYGILRNPLYRIVSRWTYQQADELIVLTNFQQQLLRKERITRRVHVIPYGTDLNLFTYKSFSYNGSRELRFLHVANLTPVKDQVTMLKVFAQITTKCPAKLCMVGLDTLEGKLQTLCKQLGIENHVTFIPPQPHHQMSKHYQWADVFILTSLYEGQGVVWAEAAASGVLIAGTSVGLLADLGSTYAVVSSPASHEQLAQEILSTLQDRSCLAKIENAYAWAKDHDMPWTIKNVIEILDNAQR